MKQLSFLLVSFALFACSHDDKPAVTADNTASDAGPSTSATDAGSATDPTKDPCAAVRCRGGMICKVVDGTPTCVQN